MEELQHRLLPLGLESAQVVWAEATSHKSNKEGGFEGLYLFYLLITMVGIRISFK